MQDWDAAVIPLVSSHGRGDTWGVLGGLLASITVFNCATRNFILCVILK